MSFDAKDLIRILKACREAQVTELKIGDIEVKFGPGEAAQTTPKGFEYPQVTELELNEATKQVNVSENLTEAEDRLDLMQIEDPALYERLIIERELEDRGRDETALN